MEPIWSYTTVSLRFFSQKNHGILYFEKELIRHSEEGKELP